MIRLTYPLKPAQLTSEKQRELTERFAATGKPVWQYEWLKNALLEMSYGKCAYCECSVSEGGAYMEVEHVRPKSIEPNLVLEWENLLPSCKHCNGEKSDKIEPIIHPAKDIPQEYLFLDTSNYHIRGKEAAKLGMSTIKVLRLNDRERCVRPREGIGNEIQHQLGRLWKQMCSAAASSDEVKWLQRLLTLCTPTATYAATAATILFQDESYKQIRTTLVESGFWSSELTEIEHIAQKCALFNS